MKKRLIVSIQLALGVVLPAQAVDMTSGRFTYEGNANLSNSNLTFRAPAAGAGYGPMTVSGNYTANNSTITMNTFLDAGGTTQAEQGSNRILIQGDASGQTLLVVKNNGGPGASTDLNGNTFNDAGEGISLVQVAGNSTANAFLLKDGYTAVGAYQYRLYAYQPGKSDAAQVLVTPDANGHWDYRLQNAKTAPAGGGTAPETPAPLPGNPAPNPSPDTRPGLVPQAPSYLVHNNALFAQGQRSINALHQRLGETNEAHTRGNAEFYARAFGGDQRYSSNLDTQQYGYDYDQNLHGLQLGGNWLKFVGDNNQLRLGLALSSSEGRTDPRAVYTTDGSVLEASREKTKAESLAATVTWHHANGTYVDTVFGASRYRSDITTPLREGRAARLESSDVFVSVEAGYDWVIDDFLTLQPQAQVSWQKLDTDRVTDIDGVVIDLGSPEQLLWRVGVRALFSPKGGPDGAVLTPYFKLNYYGSEGPEQRALLSGERFLTGEYGHSAELGYGVTASLKNNLSFYADATWQQGVGKASRQGWGAAVGLRWAF